MRPGAKKRVKVSEEMFTYNRGKKDFVNIKCYFENDPSVAENRRCRVETEAITSAVSPQLNLTALCLPGPQLAG